MTNDQILLYLNSSSFLSFNTWLSYPSYSDKGKSLGNIFIPAEKVDCQRDEREQYTLEYKIALAIAILIRDNQIKEDELQQEIEWYKKGTVPKYWKERHKGTL